MLAAVEAAAPRIDLISNLNAVVLPKDTIKAHLRFLGSSRACTIAPPCAVGFAGRSRAWRREKGRWSVALDRIPATPLPSEFSETERARVLDVALLVLEARFAKPLASTRESDIRPRTRPGSSRRRALFPPSVPPPPPIPTPVDKSPEAAHGSMRITVGAGATTQYGDGFASFGYRLVLHDLADPPAGEPELSELQFFDMQLRYDMARSALTLDRLTFADLSR